MLTLDKDNPQKKTEKSHKNPKATLLNFIPTLFLQTLYMKIILTETAWISANLLVICLKYCSGAIA